MTILITIDHIFNELPMSSNFLLYIAQKKKKNLTYIYKSIIFFNTIQFFSGKYVVKKKEKKCLNPHENN